MSVPRDIQSDHPGVGSWSVLTAWRGSVAHGMFVPSSDPNSIDDKDVMAICVPPVDCYLGLNQYGSKGTDEFKQDEWDCVCYEVQKALRLLTQGNPNILSMLWLPETGYMKRAYAGNALLERRTLFAGRWVYHSFAGYANAQLVKMERGSKDGYMGQRRMELVEKFGYDCKNAAHLIRLLRMGIEFLQTGNLIVDRGGLDAPELLAIKKGEWELEKVKETAERLFRRAEDAYDRCTLPVEPDREAINNLCLRMIRGTLREREEI